MKKSLVYLLFIGCVACNDSNEKQTPTEELAATLNSQLVGEWNNIYLKVEMASKENSDKNETLDVGYGEWEQKIKIRPIRTFFREDGSWNSAHYTLKDSLFYDPSGTWEIVGDSLKLYQDKPSTDTTSYALTIINDTASFKSFLDWDTDGKKDDLYFGKQVKVKR